MSAKEYLPKPLKGYHLFLEHDAYNEVCTLQMTEKGPRLLDNGRLDHFM